MDDGSEGASWLGNIVQKFEDLFSGVDVSVYSPPFNLFRMRLFSFVCSCHILLSLNRGSQISSFDLL